jgi:hypothetical protein
MERLLIRMMRPMIPGSEAKRLRQVASLTMATGAWPGARQSSSTKSRPSLGRAIPSTGKKLQETPRPRISSLLETSSWPKTTANL